MLTKKLKEPVFTTEPFYDLFLGGYIRPEELLVEKEDIKKVNEAIEIVETFMDNIKDKGLLIIG